MKTSTSNKSNEKICEKDMTFQDCEVAILQHAIDENEKNEKISNKTNNEINKIIKIVEQFIVDKKLLCYGGTAINNILPKNAQFYDYTIEMPDYDFYSKNALFDAIELSDIYFKNGFKNIEAKAGVHEGTFKVFVNFIPVADITMMKSKLFNNLLKDSINIDGIHYVPPNYLRMSMYLELSRPKGDTSRWKKVLKRLNLLNQYYPLEKSKCHSIEFERKMENNSHLSEELYTTIRDYFIDEGVVFFGGYATSLYSKFMDKKKQKELRYVPDFDVICEDYEKIAFKLKSLLKEKGFYKIKIIKNKGFDELIPEYIEIRVDNETIAYIYKPIACHNYNVIHIHKKEVKIATIETILTFYLTFLYVGIQKFNEDRLFCMAKYLFDLNNKNRTNTEGLLKRFSIECYGKQTTLQDIRNKKQEKYKELLNNKKSYEYNMLFLKYNPEENKNFSIELPIEKESDTIKHNNTKKVVKTKSNVKSKTRTKNKTKKNTFLY
jgi:hypothetical protein